MISGRHSLFISLDTIINFSFLGVQRNEPLISFRFMFINEFSRFFYIDLATALLDSSMVLKMDGDIKTRVSQNLAYFFHSYVLVVLLHRYHIKQTLYAINTNTLVALQ